MRIDACLMIFDAHTDYTSKPFTNDFPRADIHELISPDILHQLIKGTFKDHVVTWVEQYIRAMHPPAQADKILADIDRRYVFSPPVHALNASHLQDCCSAAIPGTASLP